MTGGSLVQNDRSLGRSATMISDAATMQSPVLGAGAPPPPHSRLPTLVAHCCISSLRCFFFFFFFSFLSKSF
jgi:hypothetical protein